MDIKSILFRQISVAPYGAIGLWKILDYLATPTTVGGVTLSPLEFIGWFLIFWPIIYAATGYVNVFKTETRARNLFSIGFALISAGGAVYYGARLGVLFAYALVMFLALAVVMVYKWIGELYGDIAAPGRLAIVMFIIGILFGFASHVIYNAAVRNQDAMLFLLATVLGTLGEGMIIFSIFMFIYAVGSGKIGGGAGNVLKGISKAVGLTASIEDKEKIAAEIRAAGKNIPLRGRLHKKL